MPAWWDPRSQAGECGYEEHSTGAAVDTVPKPPPPSCCIRLAVCGGAFVCRGAVVCLRLWAGV